MLSSQSLLKLILSTLMRFRNSSDYVSFREVATLLAINLIKVLKNNFFKKNDTLLNIVLNSIGFHDEFRLQDFTFGVWLKSQEVNIFFLKRSKIQGFLL